MTTALRVTFLLGSLLAFPAFAQPVDTNVANLQRIVQVLQAHRNQAMDAAAAAEARAGALSDDLAKAQARIKELEGSKDK